MKYIDADRIRAEIERQIAFLPTVGYSTQVASEFIPVQNTLNYILTFIDSLQHEQPIQVNTLTWKDINDLERIINNVHYEFRNGIGEKSFGEEVLERFREENDLITDIRSPKFNIGDKICSKDGQYHDEVVSVNSDGSYKLKILGELFLPEEEWKLEDERIDGFELIERNAKKQPDVDLEKEVRTYCSSSFKFNYDELNDILYSHAFEFDDVVELARHFYELGLNARKEK